MTTNSQQIPSSQSPTLESLSFTSSAEKPLDSPENGVNSIKNNLESQSTEEYSSQNNLLYPRDVETAVEKLPLAKAKVPTLIEDSKSVKFTLPSNSMSLIQSNTPLLLNKSRDFFNFISEKSTNIMEKALLPPHLAMRKQHAITKSTEKPDPVKISPINVPETSEYPLQLLEAPEKSDQPDLTADNECLKAQIKQLEETKQQELSNSAQEIEERDKTVDRLTNELRLALKNQESLKQDYTAAIKDREGMLMRYAVSEKQLIDSQKAREASDRKLQELSRENESLTGKLKQSASERSRLCGILDTKCRELLEAQKSVEKLKEEVEMREIKLKWTQTKLKSEMDMHTVTQQNLDKAIHRLSEITDESTDLVLNFQADSGILKDQARPVASHIIGDDELSRIRWQTEAERLRNQRDTLLNELDSLKQQLGDLIKSHEASETAARHFKTLALQQSEEIEDLSRKIEDEALLRRQVAERDEILSEIRQEVEELRLENKLLAEDMECCRGREAYSLEYTQKLTETNVKLQSEFSVVEARARELEREQGPLKEVIEKLRAKVKVLEDNLVAEKRRRVEECELLAKHVAEQTQRAQNLEQRLEDSKGEISVLRRKHTVSIKELTRELMQSRKTIERFEAEEKNSMSSSQSASNPALNGDSTTNEGALESGSGELVELSYNDLDKNSLIEKILKMQRINVRRAEKIDFLEEHTRALVVELQKKTKIIQNYILHENFDAMGSNERDKYKAELARHGGIMASVYNHRVSDDTLTLELSLEINQKLQSVLEDALLKNITLKDNIDTLGEEIARLTIQNQQLKKSIK